ncbi:MAG: AsmA family protein [Alphaproteobacteria bacterium PRO2]|nr:AsmA family protein [Alphaproteobacteria bacterium PRO2]
MKRAFIIVLVLLVVLIGGALIAPSFVDWDKYKPQAIQQIKLATGYNIALNGDLGLSILPSPRIFIENVDIAAPAGSVEEHLVRVKRLDVNLAIGPLLGGKVDFSSVSLIEPDIALEVLADGKENWMTPELEAMKKPAEPGTQKKAPAIALRDVSIEKGRFVYRGGKDAKPVEVSDVNVDLSADTLQGPFKIDGEFTSAGQTIKLDGKTGAIIADANSIQVNVDGEVKPLGLAGRYAGVVGLSEPYDVQGEIEVNISGLDEKIKNTPVKLGDDARLKGMVTGSKNGAQIKDAILEIAGNKFTGDIAATTEPAKLAGRLTGNGTVNLDSMLRADAGKKDPAAAKGGFLPATIELPASFEADLQIAVPGLVLRGQSYKDVVIEFAKKENVFTAGFAAGDIPGKGTIDVAGDLKFASKSISKTGSEIYSDPKMTGTIKGQTQNIALTAEALSGVQNPALQAFKTGAIDGGFSIAPDVAELKSSTLRLGDMNMQVAAAYSPRGSRPALALDLTADALNFDEIGKKFGGGGQPKGSMEDTLRGLALPYDIDFDVGVQDAVMQGQAVKGLRAQGTARQNALKFTNLSAQNFAGSSFKLEGGIGNLKELKAIDVKFQGESSDVKGVAKMAGLDPASLPANIDKASVNATLAGDMAKMAVKASVKALNGELIASGDVGNPLTEMKISDMALQVKHRSMNEALRIFAPGAPQYASWNKPLDFYAEIDTQGKVHNLRNMKGDIAGATLSGTFSVDQSGAKPSLKGDLTIGDLVLVTDPNAAAAVSKNTSAAPVATRSSGKWSSEPINAAWMNAFNANITVKAKSITYETWAFSAPSLGFVLQDGALQIKDMKSGIYGGQMAMNATMKSNAGKAPLNVDANAKFDNVQVENLAASLARGTRLIKGTGQASLDVNVKTTGASQQALVSGLNGGGSVSGRNIVLEGFDLTRFGRAMAADNKPKDTLLGLYKTSIKGGSTAFDTLSGNYAINQGIVHITKLDLDGPTASVATKGNLNLPAWTIATDHTITLKGDVAAEVPPFTIKLAGSLDNPGQTFGQGLIQDYFNRKLERKLQGLISDKIGDDEVGGALGTLLGIQKPAPAPAPAPAAQPSAEPAAGDEAATQAAPAEPVQNAPAPAQEEVTPEQAIQGVLEGLIQGN